MMDGFSPVTRRIVAVGLLVFLALLALNLIVSPLLDWTADSLDRLAMARERKSRLLVLQDRPAIDPGETVPAALTLSAADRPAAEAKLAELLTQAASRTSITIDSVTPEQASDSKSRQIGAVVSATGTETAIISFLTDVESGSPLVRFKAWKLARSDGAPGTVKFEAVAAAVWTKS